MEYIKETGVPAAQWLVDVKAVIVDVDPDSFAGKGYGPEDLDDLLVNGEDINDGVRALRVTYADGSVRKFYNTEATTQKLEKDLSAQAELALEHKITYDDRCNWLGKTKNRSAIAALGTALATTGTEIIQGFWPLLESATVVDTMQHGAATGAFMAAGLACWCGSHARKNQKIRKELEQLAYIKENEEIISAINDDPEALAKVKDTLGMTKKWGPDIRLGYINLYATSPERIENAIAWRKHTDYLVVEGYDIIGYGETTVRHPDGQGAVKRRGAYRHSRPST